MSIEISRLKNILEAALMVVNKTMSVDQMLKLFDEDKPTTIAEIKEAILSLQQDCESRGVELKETASGYRYQARQEYSEWLSRLWEEKPARYSRAYLETLALIAYRQPVTRAEIEDVRGVAVSSSIIKTMLEREWIRVVGHRDVPGRPSLYATTKQFLDYFNMTSLEELPTLAEIKDLDDLNPELDLSDSINEEGESVSVELDSSEINESDLKLSELNDNEPDENEFANDAAVMASEEESTANDVNVELETDIDEKLVSESEFVAEVSVDENGVDENIVEQSVVEALTVEELDKPID